MCDFRAEKRGKSNVEPRRANVETNTEHSLQDDPPPTTTTATPPPEKCRVSVFVDVGNLPVFPSVNVSIPAMRAALSGQERDGEQKDGGGESWGAGRGAWKRGQCVGQLIWAGAQHYTEACVCSGGYHPNLSCPPFPRTHPPPSACVSQRFP